MTNNKPRIDWLNHGLEFIVVVIGILLAFQLNKCSSEKEQNSIINIHLIELSNETKSNKISLERAIEYDESNLLKMDTIFEFIEQKVNFTRVNQLSLELLNLGGVYIKKNAYQNLIETGDIRFMKAFGEKQKIINLYEYYKWVESVNDISMNHYSTDYYPYLKNNFDLTKGTTQPDKIYTSKVFKNILGAYYRTSKNRLDKYKSCLKKVDEYLEKEN